MDENNVLFEHSSGDRFVDLCMATELFNALMIVHRYIPIEERSELLNKCETDALAAIKSEME